MKIVGGYFEAYTEVQVDNDATDEEIRKALADELSDEYFTTVSKNEVTWHEVKDPNLN